MCSRMSITEVDLMKKKIMEFSNKELKYPEDIIFKENFVGQFLVSTALSFGNCNYII